jgi:hypothetical protein
MAVGDPERVQTVDRILDNGTLVLADGEYLRRQDLASLRVAAPEFVSDHATDDPPDPVHAPAAGPGTAERPLGTRADPTVGAPGKPAGGKARPTGPTGQTAPASAGATPAGMPAVCKTRAHDCSDCHLPYTRTSNVQTRCPKCARERRIGKQQAARRALAAKRGKVVQSRATAETVAARLQIVAEWRVLRTAGMTADEAARSLDTPERRATCLGKTLTADMMNWYIHQYRSQLPPPPAGVQRQAPKRPAPGTAERPLGTRADPTVGAPSAPGTPAAPAVAGLGVPPLGGPQSPAAPAFPMTTLSDRLMAMVERIADSEALLARAERALEILETAP